MLGFKNIVFLPSNFYYIKMNITKESIDKLNAVVKIEITKVDYFDNVEKIFILTLHGLVVFDQLKQLSIPPVKCL